VSVTMKRAVVHFTDAPMFGGAEQMILNLFAGLDRRRWSPVLLHHGEVASGELIEGSRRLDVPTLEIPRSRATRRIRQYLRETRPAIFHAHLNWPLACSEGLMAAAMARVPAVVATQQLFVRLQSRRRVLRHKLLSTIVDRYIAVSHHMAAMLRPVCFFGNRKVCVVHNGIPLAPFERATPGGLRKALAGDTSRPIVLTLARLARQKGLGNLIEAATRVPQALFVIAGDGPERAQLEAQASARGIGGRVVFLGHRRDAPELLASCDVFVLPSLYEGLPVSVLEAMASGKPVVATRIGGTDEVIQDGQTGLLVPPGDPEGLAQAIQRILADRPLAERVGVEARARVHKEFSAETVAGRTAEIYEELIERRPLLVESRGLA
jgi:glycosyltransferase involved in cell wall biosynthesis